MSVRLPAPSLGRGGWGVVLLEVWGECEAAPLVERELG